MDSELVIVLLILLIGVVATVAAIPVLRRRQEREYGGYGAAPVDQEFAGEQQAPGDSTNFDEMRRLERMEARGRFSDEVRRPDSSGFGAARPPSVSVQDAPAAPVPTRPASFLSGHAGPPGHAGARPQPQPQRHEPPALDLDGPPSGRYGPVGGLPGSGHSPSRAEEPRVQFDWQAAGEYERARTGASGVPAADQSRGTVPARQTPERAAERAAPEGQQTADRSPHVFARRGDAARSAGPVRPGGSGSQPLPPVARSRRELASGELAPKSASVTSTPRGQLPSRRETRRTEVAALPSPAPRPPEPPGASLPVPNQPSRPMPSSPPPPATPAPQQPALLSPVEAETFRSDWNLLKGAFPDDPHGAVKQANGLLNDVTGLLLTRLSAGLEGSDRVSTEDLRIALQRYRAFLERLLSA